MGAKDFHPKHSLFARPATQSSTLSASCTASNKLRVGINKKCKEKCKRNENEKKNSGKHKQAGGTKLPVFATSCWDILVKEKQSKQTERGGQKKTKNGKCNGQAENQINIKTKNMSPQDAGHRTQDTGRRTRERCNAQRAMRRMQRFNGLSWQFKVRRFT